MTRPSIRACCLTTLCLLGAYGSAQAQDDRTADSLRQFEQDSLHLDDSVRLRSSVQLSPHVIAFDRQHLTAVLEFRNVEAHAKTALVVVQFSYLDWPHGLPADTTVVAVYMSAVIPHDTVVAVPPPNSRYAGRWLSGLPERVTLGPHETKRITIRLAPPAGLPDGEYWARIMTQIIPPAERGGRSLDTKKKYDVPTKKRVFVIQDSCHIVYRQGALHMGFAIDSAKAVAQIDAKHVNVDIDTRRWGRHMLWVNLPIHLTGNVPFHGQMHSSWTNAATGEVVNPVTKQHSIYTDIFEHWAFKTSMLSPGTWILRVWFDNGQQGVPADQLVPMTPVHISFRVEIKPDWAY